VSLSTVPPDVLRRAELFDFIADLVRSWPFPGELTDMAKPPMHSNPFVVMAPSDKLRSEVILPRITVIDQRLACNAASLDLERRPLMLRLFKAFCEAEERQLSRDDILKKVYLISDIELRSERFLKSKYCNAVKLISRARILAAALLGRAVRNGVEWFVYDQERRIWCLFRMRNEYFTNASPC